MPVTAIAHPTVEQRKARGQESRARTPPSDHSGWRPAADRPDPVALLEAQNLTREPDLVPVRHGRMMVSLFTSDIYLGWTKGVDANRHFYWRQLRDMKGSALVEAMTPLALTFYAPACGLTLARAHARPGDPFPIAAYLGDSDAFDHSITDVSELDVKQHRLAYPTY